MDTSHNTFTPYKQYTEDHFGPSLTLFLFLFNIVRAAMFDDVRRISLNKLLKSFHVIKSRNIFV